MTAACVSPSSAVAAAQFVRGGRRRTSPSAGVRQAGGLRVVHVVLSLDCGGLERVVLDLVREGRRLGQDVSVVCIERPGKLAPEAEAAGARVLCVGKPAGLDLRTVGRLRAVLRDLGPDVVHTHQIGALFYAGPAAGRGVAVVHTEHGKHFARLRTRLLGRWAARKADRFFCVSGDLRDDVVARRVVPAAKAGVVFNGIDTGRFRRPAGGDAELRTSFGIPADAPVVGTVGRLNEVKRQDLLLGGFARLGDEFPDARLLVVGDGPLRDDLRGLAERLGVADRVVFAGYQANPERLLGVMDVFALTSRSEGMPLVVLEAWAAGVPVVASAVGGLPEMIDSGRTGLLFPSGDEPALAAAVADLLRDSYRAAQMGAAGRERVEAEYGLARMAETYQRHYLQLVPAGRRSG